MYDPDSDPVPTDGLLHHGGGVRRAASRHGIPAEAWLDLSTGINPEGWPVPPPPASSWRRLPEEGDGLESVASTYYGTDSLLAVAGSQAAIQALPHLRPPGRVVITAPGYAEHAIAWRRGGHRVTLAPPEEIGKQIDHHQVAVIIHPNNPTGHRFDPHTLLSWQERLGRRGGWLVVDEAFMDATPEASLAPLAGRRGLVVLRSLGKFFGLAGVRVGFVCAEGGLLRALRTRLGPWAVSGPARWVATRALADHPWHTMTREHLVARSARLERMLGAHGLPSGGSTPLFVRVVTPVAGELHQALCRRGILTRLFRAPAALRFGLPGRESEWSRLERGLEEALEEIVP